jgi:hypothetical protein
MIKPAPMRILHRCRQCQRLELSVVQAYRFTKTERALILEALEERIRSLEEAEAKSVPGVEHIQGALLSIEKKSNTYKIYRRLGGKRPMRELIRSLERI